MEEKEYKIYKITNLINGKIYIGQTTKSLKRRFDHHFSESFRGSKYHFNMKLHVAMREFGKENFCIELIEIVNSKKMAEEREHYWIETLHSQEEKIGYNTSGGGYGGKYFTSELFEKIYNKKKENNSFAHSEATKEKLRKSLKNKPKSELHKQHLSENHHLKTTHVLFFKDEHIEITTDAVAKIAKERLNTSSIKLRRASEVGDFRLGDFYLLDLENFEVSFNHKYRYSKEKNIYDPIRNDVVSHNTILMRNHHNPEKYKGINLYNFCGKTLEEKEKYIEKHKKILETALEKGKNKK